jgi:hypothetical protein
MSGIHCSNPALAAEFSRWLGHQRYQRKTQTFYNKTVEDLCTFLKGKRLKAVSPLDIHQFLAATLRDSSSEQ